jgi:hypothetical protein
LIEIGPMTAGGVPAVPATPPRLTERHVLALGLALSGSFVLAAVAAAIASVLGGGPSWAAIHLAMAGAATVAIGTFMPHFAVTLAGTRPGPARQRLLAIGLLAAGAAAVVAGVTTFGGWLAGAGAVAMLFGLSVVGMQTLAPRRDPLARRHPIVTVTYGLALVQLAAGIVIGGLGAIGVPGVAAAWPWLRPAHVWLTLFGAVSLTIFATLVYLAPTVLGARIRFSPGLALGTTGMLLGPPIAAAGFALAIAPLTITGAAVVLTGAIGQLAYLADVVGRRGPYSSEHDWRRVAVGHMVAGPAWFAVAVAAALIGLLGGQPLAGWSIGLLALPMVGGWMLQELVGSWTHLVPSVTPGDAEVHRRQRRALAVAGRTRLVAWNAGLGLAWVGLWLGAVALTAIGAALLAGAVVASVLLLARALSVARY